MNAFCSLSINWAYTICITPLLLNIMDWASVAWGGVVSWQRPHRNVRDALAEVLAPKPALCVRWPVPFCFYPLILSFFVSSQNFMLNILTPESVGIAPGMRKRKLIRAPLRRSAWTPTISKLGQSVDKQMSCSIHPLKWNTFDKSMNRE